MGGSEVSGPRPHRQCLPSVTRLPSACPSIHLGGGVGPATEVGPGGAEPGLGLPPPPPSPPTPVTLSPELVGAPGRRPEGAWQSEGRVQIRSPLPSRPNQAVGGGVGMEGGAAGGPRPRVGGAPHARPHVWPSGVRPAATAWVRGRAATAVSPLPGAQGAAGACSFQCTPCADQRGVCLRVSVHLCVSVSLCAGVSVSLSVCAARRLLPCRLGWSSQMWASGQGPPALLVLSCPAGPSWALRRLRSPTSLSGDCRRKAFRFPTPQAPGPVLPGPLPGACASPSTRPRGSSPPDSFTERPLCANAVWASGKTQTPNKDTQVRSKKRKRLLKWCGEK